MIFHLIESIRQDKISILRIKNMKLLAILQLELDMIHHIK